MAKNDVEKVTEETISKGGMLAKLYFDMEHEDKSQLQPIMVELINEHLAKEKGVVYCYGMIDEPIERDGLFVTSAIVTLLTDGFFPLVSIAFNYSPAGIEIIKPTRDRSFQMHELQSLLMELSHISLNYSKYILEHVMKPEELERMKKQMQNRMEVGRKLMDKKDEKKE